MLPNAMNKSSEEVVHFRLMETFSPDPMLHKYSSRKQVASVAIGRLELLQETWSIKLW